MPTGRYSPARRRRYSQIYLAGLSERLTLVLGDLSYHEFARSTGFNHETVRRYVQGRSTPSPAFLAVLCNSFGYSPEWLLLGKGRPHARRRQSAAS